MKMLKAIASALCLTFFLVSCEVVGGIFKAGAYSGIFLVLLILAAIVFGVGSLKRKK